MAVHQHIVPIEPARNVVLFPLACPRGIDPALWRRALRARIDEHLLAVEGLIAALDGLTPDWDIEPSLGAPETSPGFAFKGELGDQSHWGANGVDDREEENEHADDLDKGEADYSGSFGRAGYADEEPSIGYDMPDDSLPTDGGQPL